MYEIKIYGEIVSTYAKQNGAKGVSLVDVQNQLEKAEGQPVKVRINSVGGDAGEGFEIYNELRRYALNNNVKIHTFGEGMVASVATVIFLAGDVREITRNLEPFVHNAQWSCEGDNRDFEQAAKDLARWNDRLARHYAEHTDLTYAEAQQLMNQEVFITPDEAKRMKFATVVEQIKKPTIIARFNSNTNKMSKTKNPLTAAAKAFMDALKGISNKIVLTADQAEVDFYELGEDDPIEVGAKATIDGTDAEGEVVMADGNTYVFVGGELTEIREPEDTGEGEGDDEVTALTARAEAAEASLAAMTEKYEGVSAKLKAATGVIAKFKDVESLGVDNEPDEKPNPVKNKVQPKHGSRVSAAINASLNLNKKK